MNAPLRAPHRFRPGLVAALVLVAVGAAPQPAAAIVHLWDIAEIYSNADGSVQFIEMFTTGNDEFGWLAASFRSQATMTVVEFDQNLPGATANHRVLLATPGFGSLRGSVEPNFTIPAHFFDPAGDTLNYGLNLDIVTFAPEQLPTDGVGSLHRMLVMPSPPLPETVGPSALFVGTNSPTNFAGDMGQLVPEPGAEASGVAGAALLALAARRKRVASPAWRDPV